MRARRSEGEPAAVFIPSPLSIAFAVALSLGVAACDGSGSDGRNRPLALAFYYPWYGDPSVSGSWLHWDSDGHKPDTARPDGHPDVSALYFPTLGAYDSADPAVIEKHIEWSVSAGLDGWIISWWGVGSREDRVAEQIGGILAARGCPLRYTLYHEAVPAGGGAALAAELEAIHAQHGVNPCFFRPHRRPLMFAYFRSAVEGLASWMEAWPSRPDIEVWADFDPVIIRSIYSSASFFDGFHTYNPWPQLKDGGVEAALETYREYVPFLKDRGKPFALTVLPGYDDTVLQRTMTWSLDRRAGETYRRFIEGVRPLDPEFILITSFNEWHEGSHIEPSVEFGTFYLDLTREFLGVQARSDP